MARYRKILNYLPLLLLLMFTQSLQAAEEKYENEYKSSEELSNNTPHKPRPKSQSISLAQSESEDIGAAIANLSSEEEEEEQKYNNDIKEITLSKEDIEVIPFIPPTLAERKKNGTYYTCYPSHYELACLSAHVYEKEIKVGDMATSNTFDKEEGITKDDIIIDGEKRGWKIIKIFRDKEYSSYKSIIYKLKKQVVLAFEGTNSPKDVGTYPAMLGKLTDDHGQQNIIGAHIKEAIAIAEGTHSTLTLTGHSLGGWLAKVGCIQHYKSLDAIDIIHIKVVAFDPPGVKKYTNEKDIKNNILALLDITSYFCKDNVVNIDKFGGGQIGTLYKINCEEEKEWKEEWGPASHRKENFVKYLNPANQPNISEANEWPPKNFIQKRKNKAYMRHLSKKTQAFLEEIEKMDIAYQTKFYKTYLQNNLRFPYKEKKDKEEKNIDDKDIIIRQLREKIRLIYQMDLPTRLPNKLNIIGEEGKSITVALNYLEWLVKNYSIKDLKHIILENKIENQFIEAELSENDNIPKIEGYIIKREKTIEYIYNKIEDENLSNRIAVIVGERGSGKTTLAKLYAEKYYKKCYQQIWWIDASNKETIRESTYNICQHMGITFNDAYHTEKGMEAIIERLITPTEYNNLRWLIILDNALKPIHLLHKYLKNPLNNKLETPFKNGTLLITSYNKEANWELYTQNIIKNLALEKEAQIALLEKFDSSESNKKEREKLIDVIKGRNKSAQQVAEKQKNNILPVTLSQIGCYIKAGGNYKSCIDGLSSKKNPLQKFLKENLLKNKNLTLRKTTLIAQVLNLNKVCSQIKKDKREILGNILKISSLINRKGIEWYLWQYLTDKNKKELGAEQADAYMHLLSAYGIIIGEGINCQANYTLQQTLQLLQKEEEKETKETLESILDKYSAVKEVVVMSKKDKIKIIEKAINILEKVFKDSHAIAEKIAIPQRTLYTSIQQHCRVLISNTKNNKDKIALLQLIQKINSVMYIGEIPYIPPKTENGENIHKKVKEFIKGESSTLLITGKAGSGKSTYVRFLQGQGWEEKEERIPLLIPLPEYYNKHTPEKLIEEVLTRNNINENDIKSLINDYKWLFILDGYDEIKLKANLFQECDLFF